MSRCFTLANILEARGDQNAEKSPLVRRVQEEIKYGGEVSIL